jgi:hypothetical protein
MYRFDGAKLHRAILVRDRTTSSFAEFADVTRTTIHRAVSGAQVTLSSARRITNALKLLPVDPTLDALAADVIDVNTLRADPDADAAA